MTTPDKPSVLMVTGQYYPEINGAVNQCRALVRQLREAVQFTVLTTANDPDLPAVDEHDGVPVHRVFVDPSSWRSKTRAAIRMARVLILERRQFVVVHLHGFSSKSVLVTVAAWVLRKRVAVKLTSVGEDDPPSLRARSALLYWFYAKARVFIGVSPKFAERYAAAANLPRERFRLIPNGVDLARFRPASPDEQRSLRAELRLPADAAVVLSAGAFYPEKCPEVLFEAWTRLAPDAHNPRVLVFVGDTQADPRVDPGLAETMRARAAALGLGERLRFFAPTHEIEKYYRAADVFVLPSVREGLPNVLLEAMACGLACMATRLDGVTDWLLEESDAGVLVPPRDAAALRDALVQVLNLPDRGRAMGARARARIERDFSLADTARAYLALYRELMAS